MATSSPLVIVVDDDAAVRGSLKFSLEMEGFDVRAFASAEELQTADLSTCRCLVVDQHMPRTTGLELISALRNRGIETPAVLISGRVAPSVMRQARALRIPVIEKPLLGGELIESIRAAIGA